MSDRKLVSVFETQDLALLTVAKSLLENVPIRYFTENEVFQDLVGFGRLGVNVAAGPIRILVGADQEEAARQVLQDLETA